jgi:hypothetical protein
MTANNILRYNDQITYVQWIQIEIITNCTSHLRKARRWPKHVVSEK